MRILIAAVLLAGIGSWAGMLEAQQRAPMAQHEMLSMEGSLSRYESSHRLLWIKPDEGNEMEFNYTAETSLVGADRQLQIGDRLKVFYEVYGKENRAVRVEVASAAASPDSTKDGTKDGAAQR